MEREEKGEEGEGKERGGRVKRAPVSCWHRAFQRVNPALTWLQLAAVTCLSRSVMM